MANIEKIENGDKIIKNFLDTNIEKDKIIETEKHLILKKSKNRFNSREIKIFISKDEKLDNFFSEFNAIDKSIYIISRGNKNNENNYRNYIIEKCIKSMITPEIIAKLLFIDLGDFINEAYKLGYVLYSLENINARSIGMGGNKNRTTKNKENEEIIEDIKTNDGDEFAEILKLMNS